MVNRKFEIQWGGSEFIFFLGGGGTWTTVWTERRLFRDVKYLSFSFECLFYAGLLNIMLELKFLF